MNHFSTTLRKATGHWFVLLCLLTFQGLLQAQQPKISAVIEPNEIRPGGFSNFSIIIEGGQPDAASELKLPKEISVVNPSASYGNQTNIVNGVVSQSAILTWQISSATTGEHAIPEQEIMVGGKLMKTNATKLVVKDNPNSASAAMEPLLTIEVSKTQIYIGEVVPVTVNLYVHRRTNLHRIGLIEMPKENFAVQRFPMQAQESQVTMGGVPYRTLSFQSTLSALKPGKFKLGPATMEIIIEMPTVDERFQHPFFNQFEPRKLKPTCNEVEITVLPLPTEDKPAGFSGIVGDFQLRMSADPKEVALGDPISVELNISGTGNFDSLTAPALTNADEWKQYPARRLRTEPYNSNSVQPLDRSAIFQTVIMPKKAVTEIPPFEFSFFSPTQKKYVTLKSESLPIKVKAPERTVEAAPAAALASGTTGSAEEADKVTAPNMKMTDILTMTPMSASLLVAPLPLGKDREFLMANIILGSLFILLIAGRVGKAMLGSYFATRRTPTRELWRQLNRSGLTRARFYELAASYIATAGLRTEKAEAVLRDHQIVNYGRSATDANEPIKPEESKSVLDALRDSASA